MGEFSAFRNWSNMHNHKRMIAVGLVVDPRKAEARSGRSMQTQPTRNVRGRLPFNVLGMFVLTAGNVPWVFERRLCIPRMLFYSDMLTRFRPV